jgi:phosphoglycerol transferase MdoB-like AlkP superfamily enzyme
MKTWLRLTLITMTVGGGFAGIAVTLQALFNSPVASTLNLLAMIVFLGLYVFVTISGLIFVHDPKRTGPLMAALAIQIPSVSSSFIVYKFAVGVRAFLMVSGSEGPNTPAVRLSWDFFLGSSWTFSLLRDKPPGIGVNVAALAILAYSWQALRSGGDQPSPTQPESEGPATWVP